MFDFNPYQSVQFPQWQNLPQPAPSYPQQGGFKVGQELYESKVYTPGEPAYVGQALSDLASRVSQSMYSTLLADPKELEVDQVLGTRQLAVVRKCFKTGLPYGAIGKGAFGMVYKATKNQAEYGVKMFEGASKQFPLISKEIEIMRIMQHPSIINFVESISHPPKDWMFIVMEYVPGGDLLGRLTLEPHAFVEHLVRAMAFHISCGLAYAHQQGILHRDIKPENILLTLEGFPKLCDFGLSRQVEEDMVCQTVAGTPTYIAPEVPHKGSVYDFPADVYSFGLVLADMMSPRVCCEWYFDQISPEDQQKYTKRWPLGSGSITFSEGLRALQQRMVKQVPGERGSVYDFCKGLEKLGKDDPLPHPFWGTWTIMPQGPPKKRAVSAKQAVEIAAKGGYKQGQHVRANADGQGWRSGVVEHVNTTVCPGALHVRLEDGDRKAQVVLVCPWQFAQVLRPDRSSKGGKTPGESKDGKKKKCCVVQ